jgi:hypothetical protein
MDAATSSSLYEQEQIARIVAWRKAPPGIVAQATGLALSPVARMLTRVVPPALIETVLRASDWLAERSVAAPAFDGVEMPLETLDREAEQIRRWAIAYGSGEGAIAGAAGLASLPLDVPAVVTLSLRTIRRTALAYGYAGAGDEERRFIYGVLGVASANSMPQKLAALNTLRGIETTLLAESWAVLGQRAAQRAVGAEALLLFIRDLAEQLGINLTRRRILAAVPIAGAAIGALMNGWYVRDVAEAAQRAYQERWLRDRGRFPDEL